MALNKRLGRGQRHPAAQQVSPLPAPLPTPLQDMGRALAGQEVEGHILPELLTHYMSRAVLPASVSLPVTRGS